MFDGYYSESRPGQYLDQLLYITAGILFSSRTSCESATNLPISDPRRSAIPQRNCRIRINEDARLLQVESSKSSPGTSDYDSSLTQY